MEKVHWRKTAKVCPECHTLHSLKKFIENSEICAKCEFGELISQIYKQCPYCRNFYKKEELVTTICTACKHIANKKNRQFKKSTKLSKNELYICNRCNCKKSYYSYARGSDINNLICKACITSEKIKAEGSFRCSGCCSVFPKEECYCNKYCLRCYEKNKIWNREKQKQLRKDPEWKQYFKEYSRYRYWNIFKPFYNNVLSLQWAHRIAKKRCNNKNGFWYCLNRSLFGDLKKRPAYWMSLTNKVIQQMKTGHGFPQINYNPLRNDSEWRKRMTEDW